MFFLSPRYFPHTCGRCELLPAAGTYITPAWGYYSPVLLFFPFYTIIRRYCKTRYRLSPGRGRLHLFLSPGYCWLPILEFLFPGESTWQHYQLDPPKPAGCVLGRHIPWATHCPVRLIFHDGCL